MATLDVNIALFMMIFFSLLTLNAVLILSRNGKKDDDYKTFLAYFLFSLVMAMACGVFSYIQYEKNGERIPQIIEESLSTIWSTNKIDTTDRTIYRCSYNEERVFSDVFPLSIEQFDKTYIQNLKEKCSKEFIDKIDVPFEIHYSIRSEREINKITKYAKFIVEASIKK